MASTYYYDGEIRINTAIEADGFEAGGKDIEAAARRLSQSVSRIGDAAKIALQKQTDAFVKQNQMYAKQERKVEALKNKYKELSTQKVETDEFSAISAQIYKEIAKLGRLVEVQKRFLETGGKKNSSAYKKRQLDIDELRMSIQKAKGEQDELLQSGSAYRLADTSQIKQQLFDEEQRLAQMSSSLGTSWRSLKVKADGYNSSLYTTASLKQRLKKSFSTLGNALKETGKKILGLEKQTKRSNLSLGRMLGTSLLLSVAFRTFSTITQGVQEGIQNLAQYSDETNNYLSAFKSSLTQLKNSFATAFKPILSVVTPILTSFINLLSKAMNYVGMFFAALTGKDTFTKAVAVQEDYAASIKKTADAANKAQQDYTTNLDEINKVGDIDSSSGNVSVSDMFKEVEIPNSFKASANRIKKLFEPIVKQFETHGKEIKEITSEWFADINWKPLETSVNDLFDEMEPFTELVLDDLAWAYESVLLPLGEWTIEEAGPLAVETLANSFELLTVVLEKLEPVFSFLWEYVFSPFYKNVGEGIGGLLTEFNDLLEFLTALFSGDWETVFGMMDERATETAAHYDEKFSFLKDDVFAPFTKFMKDKFDKDWSDVFDSLGNYLDELQAGGGETFGGLRQTLDEFIKFIKGVFTGDWKLAFEGLGTAVKNVFSTMVSYIKTRINNIIGFVNAMISAVVSGINETIKNMNKLSYKIPEWVPKVGGETFGFNIKTITAPQIPYLATGAVIPPNAPFMAVLGDQKHGTNIEAPLDTIKQAVAEVIGSNQTVGGSYRFTAQINRRTVFDEIIEEAKVRRIANGKNPFELA